MEVLTKSIKLEFFNIETHETIKFLSTPFVFIFIFIKIKIKRARDAAIEMKISRNTIKKCLNSKKPYGKYMITSPPGPGK